MDTEHAPFCQQNIRLWIILLVISAALVLGFALWLATQKTQFHGFGLRRKGRSQALSLPRQGSHRGPGGVPVAFNRVTTRPNPPVISTAPSTSSVQVAGRTTQEGMAFQLQSSFNRAADVIRPSVVNINAVRPSNVNRGAPGTAPQFVDPFDGIPEKMFGQMAFESVGSGVIVDPAGYIVTNDHLVSGATAIMVTRFNQGNEHLPARLLLTDPRSDLALLKLDGNGAYPAARFADSSKVEVGDWVMAVGNPFGLGHTVTAGIISGRRSSLVIAGVDYKGLLQTDAPINQGSSGGPLVNLQGEVVGINTAIYAPTGVFNGTGFAIPANRVGAFIARNLSSANRPVAQQQPLVAPRLGLGLIDLTPGLAAKVSCPLATGAFVSSVQPGSPAAEAELVRGDVITAISGYQVRDVASAQAILATVPLGQTVPVLVWRNGKQKTLSPRVVGVPIASRALGSLP